MPSYRAHFYRGYLQQDRGLVIQPFITASANFKFGDDLEVQPYIGWTNTFFTQDSADIPATAQRFTSFHGFFSAG